MSIVSRRLSSPRSAALGGAPFSLIYAFGGLNTRQRGDDFETKTIASTRRAAGPPFALPPSKQEDKPTRAIPYKTYCAIGSNRSYVTPRMASGVHLRKSSRKTAASGGSRRL